jgi:hypothetical protein
MVLNTLELGKVEWYQQTVGRADSESSAYLHGNWLKTKKYHTVILVRFKFDF